MEIKILSSQECENKESNNGDCIIIDNGEELVIYDCGCEDYANYVLKYMEEKGYESVKVILSHNDDDHFKGIPLLIENNKVYEVTTVLLLKYVDELLDIIDDGRREREPLKEQITEVYDNIKQLSGCNLKDPFVDKEIATGIFISGPSKEYILDAAAKGLDTREGDIIDGETITNATSIHLSIELDGEKVLLTGDSSSKAILQEELKDYKIIQLSHHGKPSIAEEIFEELEDDVEKIYVVSDNTGKSNGGSDDLDVKGKDVRNTKDKGMILLNSTNIKREERGSFGEICNFASRYKK